MKNKRVLSLVLALAMVLSLLSPATTAAAQVQTGSEAVTAE